MTGWIEDNIKMAGFTNHPDWKLFEIWCEGYMATGEHGTAHLVGKSYGANFDDAVEHFMDCWPVCGIERNGRGRYVSAEAFENRSSNWNIWACNLYDNEETARKFCG